MTLTPHTNRLNQETSPYLLQHKDNPVHWQPWDAAALKTAQDSQRPILLSIGYAACHWCHVMAHESFEDPETATVMNALFVNIKVDREERPDLDAIYQAALATMEAHGGWPLTMFLTPDLVPFWGGTYFPKESRFGRPAFKAVLKIVADIYERDPEKVAKNAAALHESISQQARIFDRRHRVQGAGLSDGLLKSAAARINDHLDDTEGGVRGAPKFPQPSLLQFLWRQALRTGDTAIRKNVLLTLDRMCQGGLYDHIGGGFARYSTDARWLVPHFEKMLYDNAQLIDLLTIAWRDTDAALFANRIAETVDWADREMIGENGAFAATLDADSPDSRGHATEGSYYVWRYDDIMKILPPEDSAAFCAAYDITPDGNWNHRLAIPNRLGNPPFSDFDDRIGQTFAAQRALLRDHRVATRKPPARDHKILADWNGLMIAALARAAATFSRPDWHARAETAFAAIVRDLVLPNGRLAHSMCAGKVQDIGLLEDYAEMCQAGLALYQNTGRKAYLDHVRGWIDVLDRHYRDPQGGGYYQVSDHAPHILVRMKPALDNAVPAGNGTLASVFATLYHLTGEAGWADRVNDTIDAFALSIRHQVMGHASLFIAHDILHHSVIVAVPRHETASTEDFLHVAATSRDPSVIRLPIATDDRNANDNHPALGGIRPTDTAAYVCENGRCLPPVRDPSVLRALLSQRISDQAS